MNVSPGMGTNSQVYRSAYSVSLSTPKASEITSLLGWMATGKAVLSPPVPTSIERMPRTWSSAPSGVMGASRSYWCCWPFRTRSAFAA